MDPTERHAAGLWKRHAPDHQGQRFRRQNFTRTPRFIKYCLLVVLLLLTFAIYQEETIFTRASGHAPTPSDQSPVDERASLSSSISTQPNHPSMFYPKFGKCTASFGDPDPPYEAAIASHDLHNQIHGYPHYILREHMIRGLWSKHGWIMTVIGQELSKPEEQRLKWLMWHDRDTVLMNPQIPLDIFVPPEANFSHINLLVTKDRNGLNNGVFMIRVGQWAMKLFASALSIREYQPELVLKYTEQSGMEETIKRVGFSLPISCICQHH
ncbi:unnamed protein product [Periconia digitata]|uniref:Galactosyl transferase GMA12/MNN10 family protein n=1 Tax=Periconia digitata TaxID=1303443 RepID=A0A9W4USL3_9PLEO|nr:unnamed protein product [Periconia digitata]